MASLLGRIKTQLTKGTAEAADPDYRILFVCMGNICRSPTVEGVFRRLAEQRLPAHVIDIDSAGTHGYHVGQPPDPRAQRAAERRGIDLSKLRARRVVVEDFAAFDLVVAMDPLNVAVLHDLCPPEYRERVRLLMEFAPSSGREDVPDPYYGGSNGFEYVLDLAEEASAGLLEHVEAVLKAR
ncbi:MAG: low molecular weight protein-tyrosine-phosphatase [Gammaproteobacteria bacterium]|nr:low molecular weight protein-tyrosine-phosphatase [Gammaproteobacteria bacterium]